MASARPRFRKISLLIAGRLCCRGCHFWLLFRWIRGDVAFGYWSAIVQGISLLALARPRFGKISLLIADRLSYRGFHFRPFFSCRREDFFFGYRSAMVRRISLLAIVRL